MLLYLLLSYFYPNFIATYTVSDLIFFKSLIFMQKLRDIYKQTQRFVNQDIDKLGGLQRMKKALALCNKQFNIIVAKNDYTDLDEISFYRDKFSYVVETLEQADRHKLPKQIIQRQIIDIVKDDFMPQVIAGARQMPAVPPPPKYPQGLTSNGNTRYAQNPKGVIQNYFDNKKEQIQRSKVGFKSVLQSIPYAPQKFPIKNSSIKKVALVSPPDRSQEIHNLQSEIQKLKNELAGKQSEKKANMQEIQTEKRVYEDRIKELTQQLNELQVQNTRLKEESVKSYDSLPVFTPKEDRMPLFEKTQDHQPYHTYYRQNDINKIKIKGGFQQKHLNGLSYPASLTPSNNYSNRKIVKQDPILLKIPNDYIDISPQTNHLLQLDRKHSTSILSSNKSVRSSARDDARSIAIKSKLCFFKQSMIIYRGQDFQIAVKSIDVIQLEVKRVSIYVNNKSNLPKQIKFQYKYDKSYYELKTLKKLTQLDGKVQGKEQVQVRLLSQNDLDSLIEVKISIYSNELAFLLPVMFIEFCEKRPTLDKSANYSKQQVNPIHQFADFSSASELLPLEKIYGQLYQTGRVYAISKHHEGYITFRWMGRKINVETIPQWKLFICYLLFKQY